MSLFEKKQSLSRKEMRRALKRASPRIPGTGGKKYSRLERMQLEKETFDKKYGGQISKRDYQRAIEKMRISKLRAKTSAERERLEQKINYLKKIGGM